jgi:hypothetical protein
LDARNILAVGCIFECEGWFKVEEAWDVFKVSLIAAVLFTVQYKIHEEIRNHFNFDRAVGQLCPK